jgi:CubicO group peptidase (beta-lactamase class C family)
VQKNIFSPLWLTRSYFNTTPYHLEAYRSNNYYWLKDSTGAVRLSTNGRDFDPGITIPNGGWNAPLADIMDYVDFLTGETNGDASKTKVYEGVLPHATLVEMWKPLFPTDSGDRAGDWMGMSFFSATPNGTSIVGHTGTQAGFRSFFYWCPSTRTAVIAAFNTIDYADNAKYEAGFKVVRDASWEALR